MRTEGGLATPRQVRAGVPALLDEVVDRTLNSPPRHHPVPLTTPAAVAAALKTQPRPFAARRIQPDYRSDTVPRGLSPTAAQTRVGESPLPGQASPPPEWKPSRGMRTARRLVSVVLIAGLVLLGALVARTMLNRSTANGDEGGSPNPSTSAAPRTIAIKAATGFDPSAGCNACDDNENNDQAAKLFDDRTDTSWTTKTYLDDPITVFKPGIGFVVDLGSVQNVRSVEVRMNTGHTKVVLMRATDGTMPSTLDGFQRATDTTSNDGGTFTLTPKDGPVEARYLLVWYTQLPAVSGGYRAEVSDATVQG
jgi:hypothetical protein